jgi:hypothetical protein
MNLIKEITGAIAILAELKTGIDLLRRERDILANQNTDLRRKLKKLQPVGRNE